MARFYKGYERRRSVKSIKRLLTNYKNSLGSGKKETRQLLRKLDGVNATFAYFTRRDVMHKKWNIEPRGRRKSAAGRQHVKWAIRQNMERWICIGGAAFPMTLTLTINDESQCDWLERMKKGGE